MQYETGKIDKGWGYELVFANTDRYSGKLLVFDRAGSKTSMVFHKTCQKTWFVSEGSFKLSYIEATSGRVFESVLEKGGIAHLMNLSPHCLEALEDNSIIFETGSGDPGENDRVRLAPGDTQKMPPAPI
jgi:mannose-6-phosphate isomerase